MKDTEARERFVILPNPFESKPIEDAIAIIGEARLDELKAKANSKNWTQARLESEIRCLADEVQALGYDGMTGKITTQHIGEGACGDAQYCALALAVGDMFAVPPEQIEVDGFRASIYDVSLRNAIDLELSQPLRDWIDAFDDEKEVEPVGLIVTDRRQGYLLDTV